MSSSRRDLDSAEPSGRPSLGKHRSSHKHREHGHGSRTAEIQELPFHARHLSKADLDAFGPLFAEYLSLQKQKDVGEMDDREIRGRWKSFLGKWNRGQLAEGWYDPEVFDRISAADASRPRDEGPVATKDTHQEMPDQDRADGGSDSDDDYGPTLPSSDRSRSGPGIPTLQDLSLRAELTEEDKQASITELRNARKADRALQRERLDDVAPRAEPGTRERMLEKRAVVADKMRSFRDKSPGMEAGNDKELMGDGDSLEEYKKEKQKEQRRKTEREIRREEVERAKREEMEERRRAWKEREEGTVGMLRELAKQRFG